MRRSTTRSRPSLSSSVAELWDVIADEASAESSLWTAALLPAEHRELTPIFSALGERRFALGIETIYEGYLVHYGRPRLFRPRDGDTALLLGDYLYAHGLVRIAALDHAPAVADLAELISLCAHLRAQGVDGDGAGWAATAALAGEGALAEARNELRTHGDPQLLLDLARRAVDGDVLERALAAHSARVR